MSLSGSFDLNNAALEMPELMQKVARPASAHVNMVQLGTALNSLDHPPVKALFVYNSNPAAVCPNHNAGHSRAQAARPCSRSCTNNSSPTPPTTPTSCCRRPPSSSTKTCKPPTDTTTSKSRTRPWSRSANAGRTSSCFAHSLSAWDLRTTASARRSIP